jgi:molybdenum cofactor cytidylyltransferase
MLHPQGGLKNIPAGARRIALLNQADSPELQAKSTSISLELLSAYDAVIISSRLQQVDRSGSQIAIHAVHEHIAGVILAAGESRRFGAPKQILEWKGKPLVWHVAQRALQAGLHPVIVVCGAQLQKIQQVLTNLPVDLIHNPDWTQGQGTSVKAGVGAVPTKSGGILFMLADQPQIPVTLIRKLMDVHSQSMSAIIGPLVDGQRANPVLFDQRTFDGLKSLPDEIGGRGLFSRYPVQWIPWHEDSPLLDIDSPEDFQRLLESDL